MYHFSRSHALPRSLWRVINVIGVLALVIQTLGPGLAYAPNIAQAAPAANPSADLDQCANGSLASPNSPACNPDEWVNGNLGESKAHYYENDSVPYRMRFDNLSTSGSHTVTIEWDTTKSGKHALDYLTTYNRTVTTANPCAGVTGCGSPTTFTIPADPQVTGAGVTPIAGNFTLFNGTITAVSAYSYPDGAGFSGDKSSRITLTFTASNDHPVLAWGGHISSRDDWGENNAAVNIPGSPYHMRLIDLDGSGGNQDRSLSAAAVIFPGSITVVKDATPNGPQSFGFTTNASGGFSLVDDGTTANTHVISNITDFTDDNSGPANYTVTESAATNWSLDSVACVDPTTDSTGNTGTRTATIEMNEGENITCTFANSADTGSITVHKLVDADGNGTYEGNDAAANTLGFDWGLNAETPARDMGTTATGVAVGSTTVSEDSVTGYHVVGWYPSASTQYSCANPQGTTETASVTVVKDQTASITFCNAIDQGTLTVVKNVVGGSAVPGDWQIHVEQQGNPVAGSPQAGTSAGTDYTLSSGSYDVSETGGPAGYTLAYSDDCDANGSVTVPSDGNATCTLTNTRDVGRVKIVKVLDDLSNPTAWTFDVTGFGTMNHDQYETLDTGSYPVTELGPDGYTLDHVSGICDAVDGETFQLHVTANGGTCTVYNTLNHGSLTVTKVVDSGSALPEEFGFRIDDGSYTYPASGQSTVMFDDLTPGTYSVTETGPAGYHQVSTTCEDVSVAPDQDATCVIHNARDTGTVTVNKYFDDNGDGQTDRTNPEGWTWDVTSGPQDTPGGQSQVLETGNYTVTEDAIPGYATTWYCQDNKTGGDGTSIPVPLPNDGDQLTCAFVNTRILGSIEVCKKIDVNGDGDVSGDPYYTAGWDMTLDDSVMQTTGENGCTTFEGLVPGDHSVMEASKDGWVRTYPADSNTQNVSVAADQTATVVFGNAELGDIHGYKWNDLNGNGVRDCFTDATTAAPEGIPAPCEPLLSGWTIQLWKGAELVGTTTTDDGVDFGWYHFGNLAPGEYTVCEEGQPGWAQTYPDGCHTIELESNEEAQATFGNQPGMSKITGTKYYDWDHSGDLTSGDTTLGGWTIELKSGETVLDSTVTAPDGTYSLPVTDGLTPGSYDVCEVLQTNWSTENPLCQSVQVNGEQDVTGIDFFNHQNDFAIHGFKWDDQNANGQYDCTLPSDALSTQTAGDLIGDCEPKLDGWTIFLDENGNGQWDDGEQYMQTSDDSLEFGWYWFEDLEPGDYTVCEVPQAGWTQTYPSDPTCHTVHLPNDDPETENRVIAPEYNFGNVRLSSIVGFKWEDLNGNGRYDCAEDQADIASLQGEGGICEPRLDNWTITIQKIGDEFSDATQTVDGWYEFEELLPGAYLVCEEQQDGWTQSYPTQNEGCHVVFLNGDGGRNGDFNFGNYTGGTITGMKWNDLNGDGVKDAGEPGLEGWTINLWTSCSTDFSDYDMVPSGRVDGSDLSAFAAAMGSNDPSGDFDGNGVVDRHDQGCFEAWFGNSETDPASTDGPYALNQSTLTDADGNYAFHDVQPGSYFINETQQVGWMQTAPAAPGTHGPVTVMSSDVLGGYDFGNFELGSIAGMKWEDANGDGVKDQSESGLEGWTINLYADAAGAPGNLLNSMTTSADGSYSFTGLTAGTYWVNETNQDGWTQTAPANSWYGPLVITSGMDVTDQDFGNQQTPTVVVLLPQLTIVKSVDDTLVAPGDQVTYTVVVSNVGEGTAENVVLRDTQETGLTLDSTGTTTNEWDLGDIASGDSVTVTYTATVDTDAANGEYTNVAEAQADNNGKVQDDASVTVRRPGEVLGEESTPELAIEKSVNVSFANPGATVTYTVVVSNTGDALAENVVLTDTLEAGLTFAANGTVTQTWNLGDLPSGTSVEVHYDVTVAKTATAGTYENLAVADADNADPVTDTVDLDVRLGAVLGAEDLPRSGGDRAALMLLLMAFVLLADAVAVTTKRSQA